METALLVVALIKYLSLSTDTIYTIILILFLIYYKIYLAFLWAQ